MHASRGHRDGGREETAPASFLHISREQAREVAKLWSLRARAVSSPAYDLRALSDLDERISANLDGLRIAGDAAFRICESAARDHGGAGEVFAATALAALRADIEGLARVLAAAARSPILRRGIVSALGWLSFAEVDDLLRDLMDRRNPPELRYLGIAGASAHRRAPAQGLDDALGSGDEAVQARALRAIGELGLLEELPSARRRLGTDGSARCFWAAWSGALLGDGDAVDALWRIAGASGGHAAEACAMAARCTEPARACESLRRLGAAPGGLPAALSGAAALGDPALVPWLLDQLAEPGTGPLAADALWMITGTEVTGAAQIRGWWSARRERFACGSRYLAGQPLEPRHLEQVLRAGRQPMRAAAAVELCLARRSSPLFEIRAPAYRQQRLLGWS